MTSPTHSQLVDANDQVATICSHFYCVQHTMDAPPVRQQLLPTYEMILVLNFGPDIPVSLGNANHIIG